MIEGWTTYKLNDVALIETGGNAPQGVEYFTSNGLPFVRVQHFDGNKVYVDRFDYITDEAVKKYRLKSFPKESILFPKSGASINLEKRAKLPFDAFVVSHIAVLIAKENVNNDFLYYWTKTQKFSVDQSGSTLPYLNIANLKERKILLPPLPEQRKIAYILSTVQKAIEQQDKLIRTTTELKKALMQKLFTEGVNYDLNDEMNTMMDKDKKNHIPSINQQNHSARRLKQTEIGPVPESWEVVELGKICEKPQYGFTDSASSSGNAKFLRITDITEFGVDWNKVPYCNCPDFSKYELKDGDIVFARIGATTGKSYLINNPPKSVYASYLIRVRCKKEILPDFLIYYFASEKYWKQIDATKGNNLKGGVNSSILSKLLVPKPSISEQSEIAKIFRSLDNKLAFHQKKKQTLTALFKTLLHELMTGQRRVHGLNFDLK